MYLVVIVFIVIVIADVMWLLCRPRNEEEGVDLIEKLMNRTDSRVRPGVFGEQ